MAAAGNRIVNEIPGSRGSSPSPSTSHALTSWKEIAAYVGKSVRTVQRWESQLGLPVRRPNPGDRNIVLALPEELDRWLLRRMTPRTGSHVDCAPQLQRMLKLVSVMKSQTELTRERAADLVKKFRVTTARAAEIKKNGTMPIESRF
jgi:hypothetical protein